ncbi:hypothetical protein R1flu_022877 [Riccia fluitans]|uniref:Uncharacterized protein n=1 Tax=Riccia fluitans TaxID=41844 RepID=A0ABD1XQY7_9MARC
MKAQGFVQTPQRRKEIEFVWTPQSKVMDFASSAKSQTASSSATIQPSAAVYEDDLLASLWQELPIELLKKANIWETHYLDFIGEDERFCCAELVAADGG